MPRLAPAGALALAALVFFAAPSAAQGTQGFQFGLKGGVSTPTSDTKDAFDTGWHGGLVLSYELPVMPLGLRIDGEYHHFDPKTGTGFIPSKAQIIGGNANLVLGLKLLVVKPYLLGGVGIYNVKFETTVTSPPASVSSTDFGWNAGVGVAFVVGKVSIFVEGRYHEISLDAGKFKMIPVSAGILF